MKTMSPREYQTGNAFGLTRSDSTSEIDLGKNYSDSIMSKMYSQEDRSLSTLADGLGDYVTTLSKSEIEGAASPNRGGGSQSGQITTVMLRNIPNKYTQRTLLEELCRNGFASNHAIDFFYLPIDSQTNANFGYAFINFTSSQFQEAFRKMFEGRRLERYNSRKILSVVPASLQGLQANWNHYSMSTVMSHPEQDRRPLFFNMDWSWAVWNYANWSDSSKKSKRKLHDGSSKSKAFESKGGKPYSLGKREEQNMKGDDLIEGGAGSAAGYGAGSGGFAKFCGDCGSKRVDIAKFCTQCGSKFQDGPLPSMNSPTATKDSTGCSAVDLTPRIEHEMHMESSKTKMMMPKDAAGQKGYDFWYEVASSMQKEGIAPAIIQSFIALSSDDKRTVFQHFQNAVHENRDVDQSGLLSTLMKNWEHRQ